MVKNNLKIITDTDKLSKRAQEVNAVSDKKNVDKVINKLKTILTKNKNLVALSAPQIGKDMRVFCINFAGDIRAFINPMISKSEGLTLVRENCASIPDKEFIVPRNEKIIAFYQKPGGVPESNRFESVAAQVFQQQVNLLDGVLISDFGLEVFEEFDQATEEEKTEVINLYLDNLKTLSAKFESDIENSKDLKEISNAIKFMTAVANNEVTLESKEAINSK